MALIDKNGPKCPICNSPVRVWAYAGDGVGAECTAVDCSWSWKN